MNNTTRSAPIELTEQEKIFTLLNVEERRTVIQHRPDGLFLYNAGGRTERDQDTDKKQLQAARKIRYQGRLSLSAQKNLVRAFDNLLVASNKKQTYNKYLNKTVPYQLSMITLTLPTARRLSSKEQNKRLLKRFLQRLEDYCQLTHRKKMLYLWKIELQARGQLHWHIILNCWIPYELINKWWAYLLRDTGMTAEFYQHYGSHEVKSATRVESVRKNSSGEMRAYMLKRYIKKDADKAVKQEMKAVREKFNQGELLQVEMKAELDQLYEICSQIDGSVWGCSDPLKAKYPELILDTKTYFAMKDRAELYPADFVYFKWCMIIRDEQRKPPGELINQKFRSIINSHRDLIRIGGEAELKKYLN